MDKKGFLGSEIIIWFFRFFLIILVITVIVYAVNLYYSGNFDIREAEGRRLADKITDCITKDGFLAVENFNNLAEGCRLGLDYDNYHINLSFKKGDELKISEFGNKNIAVLCEVKSDVTYRPNCVKNRYYLLLDEGKEVQGIYLDMKISISKTEKNA